MSSLVDLTAWRVSVPDWTSLLGVKVGLCLHYYLLRALPVANPWRKRLGVTLQLGILALPVLCNSEDSILVQGVTTVLAFYLSMKLAEACLVYDYYQVGFPSTRKDPVSLEPVKPCGVDKAKVKVPVKAEGKGKDKDHGQDGPGPRSLREYWIRLGRVHPSPTTSRRFPFLTDDFDPTRPPSTAVTGTNTSTDEYYDIATGTVVTPAQLTQLETPADTDPIPWNVRLRPRADWRNDPAAWVGQRLGLTGCLYSIGQGMVYGSAATLLVLLPIAHPDLATMERSRLRYQGNRFPAWPTAAWCWEGYAAAYLFYWGMNAWFYLAYSSAAWLLQFPTPVIFDQPFLATSPRDFWSRRWNLLFKDTFHIVVFKPVQRRVGGTRGIAGPQAPVVQFSAALAVFLFSGLLHEYILIAVCGRSAGEEMLFFVLHGLLTCGQVGLQQVIPPLLAGVLPAPAYRRLAYWTHTLGQTAVARLMLILVNNALLLWTAPLFLYPYLRDGFHLFLSPIRF
ncbi:hypothetical protein H4R33_000451 [Dimargaris cristalligena]|nr:hypothetical protein H4R33_000451 [Dimargaris cristalligena]